MFLTDDEELRQPLNIIQRSRLSHAKVFVTIISTSVFFSDFISNKLIVIQFLISTIYSVSFAICVFHWAMNKYRAEYHQHNSES